jgi:hypothetical protein
MGYDGLFLGRWFLGGDRRCATRKGAGQKRQRYEKFMIRTQSTQHSSQLSVPLSNYKRKAEKVYKDKCFQDVTCVYILLLSRGKKEVYYPTATKTFFSEK